MNEKIYTVPIEKPMLEVVVRWMINSYKDKLLALPDVLLLLPNRRSCQECKRVFLEYADEQTLLLPRIYPIGDVDEEALWSEGALLDGKTRGRLWNIPAVISPVKRLLALANEIWIAQDRMDLGNLSEKLNLEQSARIAADIITFMDELEREEVPFETILKLSPSAYAEHWQRSLALLKHALRWWPAYAQEHGVMSMLERRNRLLHVLGDYWEESTPEHPVIAVGSTGTQPATARLLSVIHRLPQGQVILPGLDMHCDDAVWQAVEQTHPQTHLKRLLERLDVLRADVRLLDDDVPSGSFDRARLLLEASLPASLTHRFHRMEVAEGAVDGLQRIECNDEHEEAQLVALLLRETLEEEGKRAALITHNGTLARRVSNLLRRYDLEVDSASAKHLLDAPLPQFALLLAQAATHAHASIPLLAVLKHGCCSVLQDEMLLARLERECFRGIRRHSNTLSALREAGARDAELHASCDALTPLYQLCERQYVAASDMVEAHVQAVKALAGEDDEMWPHLEAVLESFQALGQLPPSFYPVLLRRCLQMISWFPKRETHPRLHILSPMEARLMRYDRLVLSGLNEGDWPHLPSDQGWLNGPLRKEVGLPDEAEHVGLEAHDWVMLASQREVFVTRAKREGGADCLPSRWLERLDVLSGKQQEVAHYAAWCRQLHRVEELMPCSPPAPSPPCEARPTHLSVTQLDTLLRDPYSIYARFVLGLKALDPLDEDIGAATLGSVVHEVLESFVNAVNDDFGALNKESLLNCVEKVLSCYKERPQVELIWSPRLEQMADWIVEMEVQRRQKVAEVLAEQDVSACFSSGDATLEVRARIDRLEHDGEGGVSLVDYKTGQPPTTSEIKRGYGGQLPISALIVEQSGKAEVEALDYWQLGSGHKTPEVQMVMNRKSEKETALVEHYKEGIVVLIARYLQDLKPYYAIPVPGMRPRYNDYEQLSRIQEWYDDMA